MQLVEHQEIYAIVIGDVFFFQAEDGIRDVAVTGVQTSALPISTPSWGGMISDAVNNGIYSVDPMYMIIPGLAIFITVMAFNLFGDGLRDALDPKSSR